MEIGLLDINGTLPCFEGFGSIPTKIINEKNISEIKDLEIIIIPGGSIIESKSLGNQLKKEILNFNEYIIGICSGFQVLSEKIDIGRKSQNPIIKEGLGLLNVNFSPLVCTDLVTFKLENDCIFGKTNENGSGFHCHTYGNIEITNNSTKKLTSSKIEKLNYKMVQKQDILSGVFKNKVFGTMIHNFLDNETVINNIKNSLKITDEEMNEIFKKNKVLKEKLKSNSKISKNFESIQNNSKKGLILLATGSESGKTFLSTSIVSKVKGKTFVSKIGPDVRDIVPSLYLLREPMLKYSSIKISDRGWCPPEEFLKFVRTSDYDNYIIEGVMGAFTGALNKKNYSGAEISSLLGFPVYIVSSCSKSGIEGAFVESIAYYSLLKDMGVNISGVILNKVYNMDLFEKIEKISSTLGIKVIPVRKSVLNADKRGLIPEVEIDYEEFSNVVMGLEFDIDIPDLNINCENIKNHENENFEEYLKAWVKKIEGI
ncbi:CobB/CobQ domain protein glutamine amidotransferase [Methanococcus vannielii SB]|uniref:CobB/CobQ domain protein glutamine amidotransferase n=1 Tax=Methanococcus vannielii (strain ATCC 35089 / DSM 1224 / JCM 13029 / OCM 148 / SB) TaxID=406327 RepID=A6UR06_METVS|nr:AAA family ATPase [Methanococcus vannielii]ABR54928.1 CobB/CobQ domain protein glutamine amidotransferase [Methanococcus vannielii SB]